MNGNQWVDDRLAALDDGREWEPATQLARTRLRDWDRQARIRRRWAWVTAAAACLGLLAFTQPRACANPRGCFQNAAKPAAPQVVQQAPAATAAPPQPFAAPAAKPRKAVRPVTPPAIRNYKESGSPDAPITCEVYSDYECPACALFYRNTVRLLMADYIETGKVKLLHRDFPLPQHAYAKLAARYANGAGQAGQYELTVSRLFETQAKWGENGEIESQLDAVLPPAVMSKVRETVRNDASLDDTVQADRAMGISDRIQATPSLVIVWKGNRHVISPVPSYTLLKSYLNDLLSR